MSSASTDHVHLSAVTHEGKVVVVSVTGDQRLLYTVRRDGFEDPPPLAVEASPGLGPAWGPWQPLPLPDGTADDASVHRLEARERSRQDRPGERITRSRYDTVGETALAAVRLVSAFGFVQVFRRARSGHILLDRFVLDGMTNRLVPALDVRYVRSRMRHEPTTLTGGTGAARFDTLGHSDTDGQDFHEPSTELSIIGATTEQFCDVVLLPTARLDESHWHVFAVTSPRLVTVTSIRSTDDGGFAVADRRGVPALHRQSLHLEHDVTGQVAATAYELQRAVMVAGEERLLRDAVRVMLTVPTAGGVVCCTWGVHADGRLAEVGEPEPDVLLRSTPHEVLLPPNTLDEVRVSADLPGARGSVRAMRRGPAGDTVLSLGGDGVADLEDTDRVEVTDVAALAGVRPARAVRVGTLAKRARRGARSITLTAAVDDVDVGSRLVLVSAQRRSTATVTGRRSPAVLSVEPLPDDVADGTSVELADAFDLEGVSDSLAGWSQVLDRPLSVRDGQVTGVEQLADGRVRVHAPLHGLADGSLVRISESATVEGRHDALREGNEVTLAAPWPDIQAVDIEAEAGQRRGVRLSGSGALRVEGGASLATAGPMTVEMWVRTTTGGTLAVCAGQEAAREFVLSVDASGAVQVAANGTGSGYTGTRSVADDRWHHLAVVLDVEPRLLVDGREDPFVTGWARIGPARQEAAGALLVGTGVDPDTGRALVPGPAWQGWLSELRVWRAARSDEDIAADRFRALLGREVDLVGYWPLAALVDGEPRVAPDLSPGGRRAVVSGDVASPGTTLPLTLADGTAVTRLRNEQQVAVVGGGTYVESVEVRSLSASGADAPRPELRLLVTGKASPTATSDEEIDSVTTIEPLGEPGWVRVSTTFVVPDHLSLVRSFGLGCTPAPGGATELAVRRHRLRLVSGTSTLRTLRRGLSELPVVGAEFAGLDALVEQYGAAEVEELHLLAELDHADTMLRDLSDTTQARDQLTATREWRSDVTYQYNRAQELAGTLEHTVPWGWWGRLTTSDLRQVVPLPPGPLPFLHPDEEGRRVTADAALGLQDREKGVLREDGLWRLVPAHPDERVVEEWWRGERSGVVRFPGGGRVRLQGRDGSWVHRAVQSWGGRSVVVYVTNSDPTGAAEFAVDQSESSAPTHRRIGRDTTWSTPVLWEDPYLADEVRDATLGGLTLPSGPWRPAGLRFSAIRGYPTVELVDAMARRDEWKARLAEVQQEVERLTGVLAATAEDLARWQARREEVAEALTQVQRRIGTMAGRLRTAAGLPAPEASDEVSVASGLSASVALLAFVEARGDLSLQASATGAVGLTYADARGRLRRTEYDPVADSANSTVQQWRPDGVHLALDCTGEVAALSMEPRVTLDEGWTVEAWLRLPVPGPGAPRAGSLVTFADGSGVRWDDEGALWVDTVTAAGPVGLSTGISLRERLMDGWHHLAVVCTVSAGGRDASVWIDGVAVLESLTGHDPGGDPPVPLGTGGDVRALAGNCLVSDLRVWDVALGADELATHARVRLSGNEPGLLAHFPLGGSTVDATGRGAELVVPERFVPCAAPVGNVGSTVWHLVKGERVALPSTLTLGEEGTIEAWVRTAPRRSVGPESTPGLLSDAMAANPRFGFGPAQGEHGESDLVLRLSGESVAAVDLPADGQWHHLSLTWAQGSAWLGVLDVRPERLEVPLDTTLIEGVAGLSLAAVGADLAELRIWSRALEADELASRRSRRLGMHEDLLWAHAMDRAPLPGEVGDLPAPGVELRRVNSLPVGPRSATGCEYPGHIVGPDGRQVVPILRRFTALGFGRSVTLLSEQRVEELELVWIGNAQTAPTLLGYIEGAPPVPSENLTVDPTSYDGASSVELLQSEGLEMQWSRARAASTGSDIEAFLGYENEGRAGGPIEVRTWAARVGVTGDWTTNRTTEGGTAITAGSSSVARSRLALRGHAEAEPHFPGLGVRYVPKNLGYALVSSALADVFVTRLRRSGRMVGYRVEPVADVPIDVNTITFMMNPARTMNGSLDGFTGSRPTSDRHFPGLDSLRARFGSVVPASYFRVHEAYGLSASIEAKDAKREAYFANFDVHTTLDDADLDTRIPGIDGDTSKAAETATSVDSTARRQQEVEKRFDQALTADEKANATVKFAAWQTRMSDLLVRAGKRNLVNRYVWDADGGLYAVSEEVTSVIEHTVASSLQESGRLGLEGMGNLAGFQAELKVLRTSGLSVTMGKGATTRSALSLEVDLSGVESRGVTDYKDRPLLPGEKVDRYRFMTFYLEGSSENFEDFFADVVDPHWLAGNDEEARALREARTSVGKPWRVLHRVTYVERPVLGSFGADRRPVGRTTAEPATLEDVLARADTLGEDVARVEAAVQRLTRSRRR